MRGIQLHDELWELPGRCWCLVQGRVPIPERQTLGLGPFHQRGGSSCDRASRVPQPCVTAVQGWGPLGTKVSIRAVYNTSFAGGVVTGGCSRQSLIATEVVRSVVAPNSQELGGLAASRIPKRESETQEG